ncbi:MAG: LamG-like jellyroll fold domain-containing protein, partial [Planctomycetota bacterium]
ELWLSTNADPCNAVLIACEPTWSPPRVWQTGNEQSAPIYLESGKKYYLMALMKEHDGGDNIAVAWKGPGFDRTVIPASNLLPYVSPKAWKPRPRNRERNVDPNTKLIWNPGIDGTTGLPYDTHDVYLGTDSNSVKDADNNDITGLYRGPTSSNEYTPPSPFENYTTYYWRVDEVGASITKGNVWSFKTSGRGRGTILREVWEGINGEQVSHLTAHPDYPDNPTWSDEITSFDSLPFNPDKDYYGTRIHGYLHPETSGYYQFWIAGDDGVELRLSTSEESSDAVNIAYHNGWTSYKEWDKYPTQSSGIIPLLGGQRYYIEALHKEHGGSDHCTVAWKGPDCPSRSVINGQYLSLALWASSPIPTGGAKDVPVDTNLSWLPGYNVTSHEVYFGTDQATLVHVVTKPLGDESYNPGTLAWGTIYYWRIDEVGPGGTTTGDVWSFKTVRLLRPEAGVIQREVWEGIDGEEVFNLTSHPNYPDNPTWSDEITSFDSPPFGPDKNYYGGRIQGWLIPVTDGDYKFWIASDDTSELWLSSSEKSGSAVLIASVPGWTNQYEWDKYGTQESVSIPLVGGQKYFIRALWKEHGGGDHCAVAWKGPDQERAIIDGYDLGTGYENLWAYSPGPKNGAIVAPEDANILSWSPGVHAAHHELYFGTDPLALTFITTKPLGDESHDLESLEADVWYYWRVDEVNDPCIWPGDIWSFRIIPDIPIADPNLVGWWKFDEEGMGTAIDYSGYNHHGTLVGNPRWVRGARDNALDFDGDDYVDCGNPPEFNMRDALTMACWIKVNQFNKIWQTIISKGEGYRCSRLENTDFLHFACSGLTPWRVDGQVNVNDGQWHHVACVYDGSNLILYVDGDVDSSAATSGQIDPNTYNLFIGENSQVLDRCFEGKIDDIRIYNRALVKPGIVEIVKEGDPGVPASFDNDGHLDFYDFSILASAWLSKPGDENWNPLCDISIPHDNIINEQDLGVLAAHWLEDTVRIVNIARIENVSVTPQFFSPSIGETATINYTLSHPADVTIKVYSLDFTPDPVYWYLFDVTKKFIAIPLYNAP